MSFFLCFIFCNPIFYISFPFFPLPCLRNLSLSFLCSFFLIIICSTILLFHYLYTSSLFQFPLFSASFPTPLIFFPYFIYLSSLSLCTFFPLSYVSSNFFVIRIFVQGNLSVTSVTVKSKLCRDRC